MFNDDGIIETEEVVVYYPVENVIKIVVSDFGTWVRGWYSGEIST